MLTTKRMNFTLHSEDHRLQSAQFTGAGVEWLQTGFPPALFAIETNRGRLTADELTLDQLVTSQPEPQIQQVRAVWSGAGLQVEQTIRAYAETALLEFWPVVRNTGDQPVRITRLDSLSLSLTQADYALLAFRGDWGSEFEPVTLPLQGRQVIETRSGRASKGMHPWFALTRQGSPAAVLSGAVAWSGNWIFRFDPLAGGGWQLSGGLNDWEFAKDLQPGVAMEGPHVVLAAGDSLDDVGQQYAQVGRTFWYPRNRLSDRLPVEWNHWWPYEDAEINEEVFARNVETAARLGMEVCTLDAGWFGPSDAGTQWYDYRGDWHLVNSARFPHGIRALADLTHARGMAFGIWCEIEAVGVQASLAQEHPEYLATRQGQRLGYVCFGNPAVQEWAFQTLSRLVREYQCDWIKLDFNLDPGAGCDRTDHGHQAGDGLYEHYLGYYRMLDRFRAEFPEVVLENCSSGGLRIDLGMLRHTYLTFVSDPDWPVHDLQIFWGASTMLAPNALLHWGYSDWRNLNPPPQQTFHPHDPNLTQKQFDYYTRISMLNLFGFSQKLPDLPGWMAERVAFHTRLYQQEVRRFVKEGNLYRLTGQPRRSGEGDRLCAFQYSLPEENQHLLFVFRLPGEQKNTTVRLTNLNLEYLYSLQGFEGEYQAQYTGSELMETGLSVDFLKEEESLLLRIR